VFENIGGYERPSKLLNCIAPPGFASDANLYHRGFSVSLNVTIM
jgi:hypothetical protein